MFLCCPGYTLTIGTDECLVTDNIYQPRNPLAVPVYGIDCALIEYSPASTACDFQTMPDIGMHGNPVQGQQAVDEGNTLLQLPYRWLIQ